MDSSDGSRLLALPHDGQRAIFELLSDALQPAVALKLGSCCRELRAVSETARLELRLRYGAARRLCVHVNTNFATLGEATQVLWYGQGLTAAHLGTLGMLMRTNALPRLEVLNLSINRFGAEGMRPLFEELGHGSLPRLRTLDLTGNALGAAGAATLAAALHRGALPKLTVLKLGRNDIGDEGLAALGPQLRRLPALREVYLHSNQIGDQAVDTLADLSRQLQTLNLERNRISDATLLAALDGRATKYPNVMGGGGCCRLGCPPGLCQHVPSSASSASSAARVSLVPAELN